MTDHNKAQNDTPIVAPNNEPNIQPSVAEANNQPVPITQDPMANEYGYRTSDVTVTFTLPEGFFSNNTPLRDISLLGTGGVVINTGDTYRSIYEESSDDES